MVDKLVRRILVPMDLSREQPQLQEYAIALAAQLGADLLFFSVIDSPTTLALIGNHPSAGKGSSGFRAKVVADAKVLLERMVALAVESGVRASGHAVVSERVGDKVIHEASERDADLILVVAEDHSMLWNFFFADSSEVISHRAPCPVLTIKPDPGPKGDPGERA